MGYALIQRLNSRGIPPGHTLMLAPIVAAVVAVLVRGQASDPRQIFGQALAAQQRGDYPAAIQQYREALRLKPDYLPARIDLGIALVHTGHFAEAIESYRAALSLDPQNRQARFYLALAYFKTGDAANASRQFEQLLQAEPSDLRIATLLGASYLQAGENGRALQVLEPRAAAAGDNPDFLWAWGSALIANGRLRDGVSAVERTARQTGAGEAWLLGGQTLLRMNEYGRARDDLELAARASPALAGVQTALGQAREKNADYPGAIQAFTAAAAQNPKDFDAWLGLGSDQYFVRDLAAARTSLNRALAIDARSAPALYALALVDKAESKPAAAASELESVVKLRPDWLDAHVQLAALYFQLRKPADGARERAIVDRLTAEAQRQGPAKF